MSSGFFNKSLNSPSDQQQRKEAVKAEISQQLALANAQDLVKVSYSLTLLFPSQS